MDQIQKFQNLLKEIFQFDSSNLDFGIYQILNYKRDHIEKFITQDLKEEVNKVFAKHKDQRAENLEERFKKAKQKVIENLNKDVFTPTGDIKNEFKQTKVAQEYLSIRKQKEDIDKIDQIKLQVFNDLYTFFSRYYDEGDFIPHYRHSIKSHKYAIPYDGEELKLYWANTDQHYTKTSLLFQDYAFFTDKSKSYKVIFRIIKAKEELGSNKATRARFFILDKEKPLERKDKSLIVRFQYRELTEGEVESYDVKGGSNASKQDKINEQTSKAILDSIEEAELKGFLGKDYKSGKSLLLYQLGRFTAKNTKDYFIHKNLKKFLSEQLDYFIKSEVLDVETLEKERFLDKHITRAKVVREIGEKIIAFLAQIEDFQKKLWEKKKFVLKTDYVITLDRVSREFWKEILSNEKQIEEWKELRIVNDDFEPSQAEENEEKYQHLPIDTKYFSQEFKEKLLEKLTENTDLDELLDGLLIKSENWQALNLLLEKYREKVQTIYIDPPFNTGGDFPYKDKFRDSSWLSLMSNRLKPSEDFLCKNGSLYLHLDQNADYLGRFLLNTIFGETSIKGEITWDTCGITGFKSSPNNWITNLNTLLYFSKSPDQSFFTKLYTIINPKDANKVDKERKEKKLGWLDIISKDGEFYVEKWVRDTLVNKEITIEKEGNKFDPIGMIWKDSTGIHSFLYTQVANNESFFFQTQKPEHLLRRLIQSSTKQRDVVMDYFLGIGTTTSVAQKLHRKWIGIEMGKHFKTFYMGEYKNESVKKIGVLGRMKIVLFGDQTFSVFGHPRHPQLSRNIDWQGGGFFKYQTLEQHEDTLDNIELKPNEQAQKLFKDDYLLKYFLDFETRGNASLLNLEKLKDPFSYKLKVNLEEVGEPDEVVVDIPETFNYLLGIRVKKVKTRESNGRKYLFILGEKQARDIAIVWRRYQDDWSKKDFKKDKEFIIQELGSWQPAVVYINGQSVLTTKLGKHTIDLRYIEPEFKTLMFS